MPSISSPGTLFLPERCLNGCTPEQTGHLIVGAAISLSKKGYPCWPRPSCFQQPAFHSRQAPGFLRTAPSKQATNEKVPSGEVRTALRCLCVSTLFTAGLVRRHPIRSPHQNLATFVPYRQTNVKIFVTGWAEWDTLMHAHRRTCRHRHKRTDPFLTAEEATRWFQT